MNKCVQIICSLISTRLKLDDHAGWVQEKPSTDCLLEILGLIRPLSYHKEASKSGSLEMDTGHLVVK